MSKWSIIIWCFISLPLFVGVGCSEDSGRKSSGGPVDSPSVEPGTSDATRQPKTLAECEAEGNAWRPVVNGGANPADCAGGKLKAWNNNCCKAAVLARFASLGDKLSGLNDLITSHESDKFTMHACSERTDGQAGAIMHFNKKDGDKTFYKFVDITGTEGDSSYNCPAKSSTFADFGQSNIQDASSGSDEGTGETSNEDEEGVMSTLEELFGE